MPTEDQGFFFVLVQAPEGASLQYTSEVMRKVEATLSQDPDIEDVFAVAGWSFGGAAPNRAVLFPNLLAGSDGVTDREGPRPLRYGLAMELGAADVVRDRRARIVEEHAPHFLAQGLGRVHGRWGLVELSSDRAVRFTPLRGGVTEALPPLPAHIEVCPAALPANVDRVLLRSIRFTPAVDGDTMPDTRVELALPPGGACLRGLAWRNARADGGTCFSRVDSTLRGEEDCDGTITSLRCEVRP